MYPDKNTTISLVTQHDATREWDGGLSDLFPLLDFVFMNDLEARSIIRCGCESSKNKRIEFEHEHINGQIISVDNIQQVTRLLQEQKKDPSRCVGKKF
jgi:hypothetical protein